MVYSTGYSSIRQQYIRNSSVSQAASHFFLLKLKESRYSFFSNTAMSHAFPCRKQEPHPYSSLLLTGNFWRLPKSPSVRIHPCWKGSGSDISESFLALQAPLYRPPGSVRLWPSVSTPFICFRVHALWWEEFSASASSPRSPPPSSQLTFGRDFGASFSKYFASHMGQTIRPSGTMAPQATQ